jgi:hypothetical protein
MSARVEVKETGAGSETEESASGEDWRFVALADSASIALVAAIGLGVHSLFFSGSWQLALALAGYWMIAELAMRAWCWILRYKIAQVRSSVAEAVAEREKLLWEIRARHAETLHLQLRIKCAQLHAEDIQAQTAALRARRESLEAELRAAWVEQGRREERARLEVERTEANVVHLRALAEQLGMRVDWMEARLDRAQLLVAAREFQEAVEERIRQAYERGFVHGARGTMYAASPHPRLALVDPLS